MLTMILFIYVKTSHGKRCNAGPYIKSIKLSICAQEKAENGLVI